MLVGRFLVPYMRSQLIFTLVSFTGKYELTQIHYSLVRKIDA